MAHAFSQSIRNPEPSPTPVQPEGFMTLAEVDAAIKRLNKHQRRLSKNRTIRSASEVSQLSPGELANLTHLIAGRQNRRVS